MIDHILDNIYISNWKEAKLNKKSFDVIITTAKHSPWIGHEFFPMKDSKSNDDNYDLMIAAIKTISNIRKKHKHKKILVHCKAGVSRSATCVAGYIIKEYNVSAKDAIDKIRKNRHKANPHPELIKLLEKYEKHRKNKHGGK